MLRAQWLAFAFGAVTLAPACAITHAAFGGVDAGSPDTVMVTDTARRDRVDPRDGADTGLFDTAEVSTDVPSAMDVVAPRDVPVAMDVVVPIDRVIVPDTLVPDAVAPDVIVDVPRTCGLPGQLCCAGATCNPRALCIVLDATTSACVHCGAPGERCCVGSVCAGAGVACLMRPGSGRTYCFESSRAVGSTGASCHTGSSFDFCNSFATQQCIPLTGSNTLCMRCGDVGWPCCLAGAAVPCRSGACAPTADGFSLCR